MGKVKLSQFVLLACTDNLSRPQSDGPALRAITLIRFSNAYLTKGGSISRIQRELYDGKHYSTSVIKVDLEYVAAAFKEQSFDLWEEIKADHFYTRSVQRRALIMGSDFAKQMGDSGASYFYKASYNSVFHETFPLFCKYV